MNHGMARTSHVNALDHRLTESDAAAALRIRWVKLSEEQHELRTTTEFLHGSQDRAALAIHAERLHSHNARMRILTADLEAFHEAYGRGAGLPGVTTIQFSTRRQR